MGVIDAVSQSTQFGTGTTNAEYTHTGAGSPRGAFICVAAWETNALDSTAATYGGVTATKVRENISTTPFLYTAIWYADNVPAGNQITKVTKVSACKMLLSTITVNATGAIAVDASNGSNGTAEGHNVASLTALGSSRFWLGIDFTKKTGLPTQRSNGLIARKEEGELTYEITGCELPAAMSLSGQWVWPESCLFACSAVMFSVPGQTYGENRVFQAEASTGYATQFLFLPTPANRFEVTESPGKSGKKSFKFERQEADPLIASGRRSEAQTSLTYGSGTERWFEFWRYHDEGSAITWELFWQLHDQSAGSPPVCLIEEGGKLFFGPGLGNDWWYEQPAQSLKAWHHYKTFVKLSTTEGKAKLWIDGKLMTLNKVGGTEVTGKNTLGEGPVYDKLGIYRGEGLAGTTRSYVENYFVSTAETPSVAGGVDTMMLLGVGA